MRASSVEGLSVFPAPGRSVAASSLSSRDLSVLRWVSEQYAVRLDQLACFGFGLRSARRSDRLVAAKLLERSRLLIDELYWLWVTSSGERTLASGFRAWRPKLGLINHVAAVNEVRLYVERRSPESVWVCERLLLRERAGRDHLPDGVVLVGGERHAVEVELTVKSERRLRDVIGDLSNRFDRVVYFCTPQVRARLERLAAVGHWPSLVLRDLPTVPRPV